MNEDVWMLLKMEFVAASDVIVFQECNLNQVIITIVFRVLIFIIEVFKQVVFLPLNHITLLRPCQVKMNPKTTS